MARVQTEDSGPIPPEINMQEEYGISFFQKRCSPDMYKQGFLSTQVQKQAGSSLLVGYITIVVGMLRLGKT